MTDEQWLWVYIHMAVDEDELMDGMCDKCKTEISSHNKCSRCGGVLGTEKHINPNFDTDKFNRLVEESGNI